jgi:alpha-L-fucosidase 2
MSGGCPAPVVRGSCRPHSRSRAAREWQDTGGDNQRWKLVDAGGAHYRLVNVRNGWHADVADGSTTDNARVIQWPTGTGTNQQWQLDAL